MCQKGGQPIGQWLAWVAGVMQAFVDSTVEALELG